MKSLNAQERRHAFLRFIAIFIFTVAIVVAAVFLNFETNARENVKLKNSHIKQRELLEKTEVVLIKLSNLDSSSNFSIDAAKLSSDIASVDELNPSIGAIFKGWLNDKTELDRLGGTTQDANVLEQKLTRCETEKNQMQRDLDLLRIQLRHSN